MNPIKVRLFVNANNATAARQGKAGPKNVSLVPVLTEANVPNPNASFFLGGQGSAGATFNNVTNDFAALFPQSQEFEVTFTPVERPTPSTIFEYEAEQKRLEAEDARSS